MKRKAASKSGKMICESDNMKTIWIIGAGKFGINAARTLAAHAGILLIDKDAAVCRKAESQGFDTVCADGVEYLSLHLGKDAMPDQIIPCVPIHLAYQWIKKKILMRRINIPINVIPLLPNPMPGKEGELYLSYADFICPDNCPEPAELCTYTGKARKGSLYKLLESLSCDDITSVVIRSRQLAPGVGGYSPQALFDALESVRKAKTPILFSTACRCHGVLHAFELLLTI